MSTQSPTVHSQRELRKMLLFLSRATQLVISHLAYRQLNFIQPRGATRTRDSQRIRSMTRVCDIVCQEGDHYLEKYSVFHSFSYFSQLWRAAPRARVASRMHALTLINF